MFYVILLFCFFFFNDTATTEIYTLSLHDALPICIRLCQPNVVVLDLEMPGLNGIEVAEELTKCPSSPAVVICSVENAPEIVEAARQAGALGYVFKSRIAEDLIVAGKMGGAGPSSGSPRR